jgi:hypothetical protein
MMMGEESPAAVMPSTSISRPGETESGVLPVSTNTPRVPDCTISEFDPKW